jgi:hypothetical protein
MTSSKVMTTDIEELVGQSLNTINTNCENLNSRLTESRAANLDLLSDSTYGLAALKTAVDGVKTSVDNNSGSGDGYYTAGTTVISTVLNKSIASVNSEGTSGIVYYGSWIPLYDGVVRISITGYCGYRYMGDYSSTYIASGDIVRFTSPSFTQSMAYARYNSTGSSGSEHLNYLKTLINMITRCTGKAAGSVIADMGTAVLGACSPEMTLANATSASTKTVDIYVTKHSPIYFYAPYSRASSATSGKYYTPNVSKITICGSVVSA